MPYRHRRNRGFTLIELLLVVVILSTAAGMTATRFAGSFHATRLRTAGRALVATGRYARARAILDGREAWVRMDRATGSFSVWIRMPTEQEAGEPDEEAFSVLMYDRGQVEPVGVQRRLPEGLRFSAVEIEEAALPEHEEGILRFYPSGASDRARIRVEDDAGRFMDLVLGPMGGWNVEP